MKITVVGAGNVGGILGTSSFDAPGVARAIGELGLEGKVFTAGTGMPDANKEITRTSAARGSSMSITTLATPRC